MQAEDPTPKAARAALDVARRRHDTVRRSDLYRWSLVVLAAALIASAVVAAILHAIGPLRDLLFVPMALAIGIFSSWRERKQLVYSRSSTVAFWITCGIFLVWGALVDWTSSFTGWLRPTADWHGVVTVLVMVLPLLVGAWLIGRR